MSSRLPPWEGKAASVRLFLLRHGTVKSSGDGKRYIGQLDLPLTPVGLSQAAAWAEFLSGADLEAIYTSDLSRCLETARIIGERCVLEPWVRPELREIGLGCWEGETFAAVQRRDPDAYERRGFNMADHRPPGGESFRDLQRRVWPFFETLAYQGRRQILLVTHAGVIRVLICRVLGMPLKNLFVIGQTYGALNIVDVLPSGYRIQALNLEAT